MLNKRMQDMTLKEGLIVTGVLTAISFIPWAAYVVYNWIEEKKEEKEDWKE